MSRLVNFRPVFYLFLAFALGIAFAYYIFTLNFLIIAVLLVMVLTVFIFAIFAKRYKQFVAIILAFCVGLGVFYIDYKSFTTHNYAGQNCYVVGRVVDFENYDDNTSFAILENVSINGKARQNLSLTISTVDYINFDIGNVLKFNAEVYSVRLFENGTCNSYEYKHNIAYSAVVDYEDIQVSKGGLTFAENFRHYIKSLLDKNMSNDVAGIAYSSLFGDKTELNQELKDSFSVAGLAHLLAVSGLHIGFLVAILFWVMKKFNCPALPRFLIIFAFLMLYCYLCDFSPSVLRASLMCLTFLGMGLLGRQHDLVNAVGISGIIILLFNPLYVFDAGFLMSFCSVLAIAMLYKGFAKVLTKIKVPQNIADAVAIDICTTLAIAPIIASYFEKLSFLSWVANLICVPVFAFAYSILFVILMFVAVFHFLGFLLIIPELLYKIIVIIANFISSLTWAHVNLLVLSIIGILGYYFILFISSSLVMAKLTQKVIMILCIVVAVFNASMFIQPVQPNNFSFTQLNSRRTSAVITTQSGKVLVLGASGDLEYVDEYLMFKKYANVDTLVVLGTNTDVVDEFESKYNVNNIVYRSDELAKFGEFYVQTYFLGSSANVTSAVYVETNQTGFLLGVNRMGNRQIETLIQKTKNYPLSLIYQKSDYGLSLAKNCKYYTSKNNILTPQGENFSTMMFGSFTFGFNNGIITKKGCIDDKF